MGNFTDNLLKRAGLTRILTATKKGVSLDQLFGGGTRGGYVSGLGNQKQQLAAYADWVYAAARAIAEDAASIDIRLYVNRTSTKSGVLGSRIASNDRLRKQLMAQRLPIGAKTLTGVTKAVNMQALEELDNHVLLDLLHSPNPFMTKDEFFELTFLHLELAGEAFWTVIRGTNKTPIELWPLMPHMVKVIPDEKNFIKGYVYRVNGVDVPLEVDDVVHHKYMNPSNLYRGMSVVQAAARAIDTDSHSADYNRKFFYNNATPDGVLYTDTELSDETFERLKKEWSDTYGGTSNAHKTAILEAGLKYQQVTISQKDMDFLESRKFNRDQILALFRVSGAILGIQENSNRATAEAAEYTFTKRVIRPKLTRLVNRITEDLAVQFDPKLVVGFTDPVPEDKAFILSEKQAAVDKWLTKDEIREMEGKEPLPDGIGEVLWQPNSVTPTISPAEMAQAQADAEAQAAADKEAQAQALADQAAAAEQAKKALEDKVAELTTQVELSKKKEVYASPDEREQIGEAVHGAVNKIAIGYEGEMIRVARKLFNAQKDEVLRNLKKKVGKGMVPTVAKDLGSLFDKDGAIKKFVVAFTPVYKANIKEAGSQAMLMVNTHGFDMEDPNIKKFLDSRTKLISTGINDETDKQLKATLTDGINAGESIDELSARVENVYGAAAGFRAERIARTETIRASGFATEEGWSQSGVVEAKEWFTAQDERLCEFCAEMDGKTVALDDSYFSLGDTFQVADKVLNLDFESIDTPPLHSNCRCTLLPVLKEAN